MLVAELVDTIWATRKSEALNGVKFLLAEVKGGRRSGELLVVEMPVDAAIVGIIDENYDEVKRQNGEIQRFS